MRSLFPQQTENTKQIYDGDTSEEEKDIENQQVNFHQLGGLQQPLINGVEKESVDHDIFNQHYKIQMQKEQISENAVNQTSTYRHHDTLSESSRQHIEEYRQPFARKNKKDSVVCFQKRQTYLKNMKIYNALYNFTPPNQRIKTQNEKIPLIQKIIQKIPVFEPSNVYLLYWEFMIFILTCIIFFFIPIELFFQTSIIPTYGFGLVIRIFLFMAFIMDLIFYLNTGFYDRGKLILDRKKIFMNYLKHILNGKIIADILSITGLSLNLYKDSDNFGINVSSYFCLLFYVRIFNLNSFDTVIIQQLQLHRKSKAAYKLLRLGIIVLFISNFFACVFYRVGVIECQHYDGKCWLQEKVTINDPSTLIYYLYALYWSITTMISVGYGDVTPVAPYEVLVCIFSMMCSCILFAYSINSIWFIISEVSQGTQRYQQNMNAINRYMRDKSIDSQLSKRINGYLDFVWKDKMSREDKKEKKIIQALPQNLKLELIYQANSFFFEKYEWDKHFSYEFLQLLAQFMKEKKYLEDDLVYHQDEQEEDQYLYYVSEGEVQLYYDLQFYNNGQGIPIQSIQPGNFIGLYEFFSGEKKHESARCIEFTNIFFISKKDFMQIIANFPKDYQKYVELKDQMVYQKNYKQFGIKCFLCDKEDHLSHQCVEIQLKKDALRKHQMHLHPELFMNYQEEEDNNIQDIPSLYARGFSQTLQNLHNSEKDNQKFYDINLRLKYDCKMIKKAKYPQDQLEIRLPQNYEQVQVLNQNRSQNSQQISSMQQQLLKSQQMSNSQQTSKSQKVSNSPGNFSDLNQRSNKKNNFSSEQNTGQLKNQNKQEQNSQEIEYVICDDNIRKTEYNIRKSRIHASLFEVNQANQLDAQTYIKSHDVIPIQSVQQSQAQTISAINSVSGPIQQNKNRQATQRNIRPLEKVNLNQVGLQRDQQKNQQKDSSDHKKPDKLILTKQNIQIQRKILSNNSLKNQNSQQYLSSYNNLADNFQNSSQSNKLLSSFDNLNFSPTLRPKNKNQADQKLQKQLSQPLNIEFQAISRESSEMRKSQTKQINNSEEQNIKNEQKRDFNTLVTSIVQKLINEDTIIHEQSLENAQSFISRKNEADEEEDIDIPPKEDAQDLNYIFYKFYKKN